MALSLQWKSITNNIICTNWIVVNNVYFKSYDYSCILDDVIILLNYEYYSIIYDNDNSNGGV